MESYRLQSGLHPETAALTALLAQAGLARPDTGAPLSEAMVLGIGGGVGIGYILWEFKAHSRRILVMGMRNRWQYGDSLYKKLEERLNVRLAVAETGGAKGAQAALDAALALGRPAMLWVDHQHLSYAGLPPELEGCDGHTVVAYGREGDAYLIDDRAAAPFRVTQAELAAARGRIPSYKNRLLTVDKIGPFDLRAAIAAGIVDCAAHLAEPSDSFSLPVIKKWARLMTDERNAKGWLRLFADGRGLFSTLLSVFEAVSDYGPAGGSLRRLYATFLDEAALLLERPALGEAAARYRQLGVQWGALGETALPTAVEQMAQAKELTARRQALYTALGGEGVEELATIQAEIDSLRRRCDDTFPLDGAGMRRLFESIQAELESLYAEEREANAALRRALD